MQTATSNSIQSNLRIFDQVHSVPQDALRPIEGGPLKGKSDINPMWRIKKLTELFGPAGIGWKIEQVARWTEATSTGETAVFCEVNLFVRQDGEWSAPIFGQGGNMLIRKAVEWVNGQQATVFHIDDEAYKKAYTDAISVACKALGFASDIYYAQEETKYGSFRGSQTPNPVNDEQTAPQSLQPQWPWTTGFKEISPATSNWKASVTQVSKMNDLSTEEILGRITSKFNITQENFNKLLTVANRAS